MKLNQTLAATLIAAAAIVTAQCGGGDAKGSSGLLSLPSSASSVASDLAVGTRALGLTVSAEPEVGKVKVCKSGGSSGTFIVAGGGGTVTILPNPTVGIDQCYVVAEDSEAPLVAPASTPTAVTVTESPATLLNGVTLQVNSAGSVGPIEASTNGATVLVNDFHGYTFRFDNDAPDPPPPTGTEGCTPGYWKNHAWVGYAPGDDFDTTFGVDFFNPNITLGAAVNLGGGGVAALARHAVAAILNVANPDVDYTYTLDQVMAIVQGTGDYSGLSVEARKNLLVTANELGCPL